MIEYPKKILLATDGTEDSARAARVAVALAARTGAELHVVHVWHARASAETAAATRPPLPGEPPGYAARQARKLLDARVAMIHSDGGKVEEAHLRAGQPAAEVVALGAEIGTDLIVVGSGGAHAVRRAVATTTRQPAIGRASDAIVRRAHCPVLVVRGDGALRRERPERPAE